MGVVHLTSGAITNRDSTPEVLSNANIMGSKVIEACGVIAAGTADSATSTYNFCTIPSNARISQVLLWNLTLGGSSAADFGFYETTANGGGVAKDLNGSALDGDEIAASVNLHQTNAGADLTHQGAEESAIANGEKMVWQWLGLTSDPSKFYDVVATITVANSGGGNVKLLVRYTV